MLAKCCNPLCRIHFAIREVEEYRVELSDVTVLELVIVPDISRGTRRACSRVCACLDSNGLARWSLDGC
jgi:hypothetical protein